VNIASSVSLVIVINPLLFVLRIFWIIVIVPEECCPALIITMLVHWPNVFRFLILIYAWLQ